MQEKRYNGWTNYETWTVKLWLDNDEGSYKFWRDEARSAWEDTGADKTFTHEENAAFSLASMLKQEHEDAQPLSDFVGVYADLLNAALSEVNWHEIARSLIEDGEFVEVA